MWRNTDIDLKGNCILRHCVALPGRSPVTYNNIVKVCPDDHRLAGRYGRKRDTLQIVQPQNAPGATIQGHSEDLVFR